MLKKFTNKKENGFTLAELLIVVAIIAVLVAIAIPIFSAQLEKSRESTDLANIRAAYAEASAASLEADGGSATKYSASKMQSNGDIEKITNKTVGGTDVTTVTNDNYAKVTVNGDGTWTLEFVASIPSGSGDGD